MLPLQSPQKRGSHQCRCGENVGNECGSVTTISSHFCIRRDHEGVRSCHLSRDAAASKEAAKSSETNASSSASSAASSATAAGNSRRRQRRPRQTPGLLKRQADRAPRLRQAQKRGCVVCQCSVNKCRQASASATAAGKSAESAASSASTATTKAGEATEQASAAARSASAAKTSETNAKAWKPAQNPQKRLPHRRQFGGVIGIIGVCFKR